MPEFGGALLIEVHMQAQFSKLMCLLAGCEPDGCGGADIVGLQTDCREQCGSFHFSVAVERNEFRGDGG